MTLEPGVLLYKRYKILEVLTHGGMGAIYRAFDESLNVEVAVKENLFSIGDYSRQFHREATILAGLRHANLPRVTDHFVIEGQGQYLVMDFIIYTKNLDPVYNARFSGDSQWIVYQGVYNGENTDIFRISRNGTDITRLTTDPLIDIQPVWRPVVK